eukprot:6404773-Prorocentrum_lima.AAC.1
MVDRNCGRSFSRRPISGIVSQRSSGSRIASGVSASDKQGDGGKDACAWHGHKDQAHAKSCAR